MGERDKRERGGKERWEGEKEEEEGDVSIAFRSKVHGGREAGMQHRSNMDSSLKVYWLPEIGREGERYEKKKQTQFYYIHVVLQKPCLCCNSWWSLVDVHLTFQTSGVELDEELGSARRLHDGLNALELDVGLLWRLGQTCAETGGQEEEKDGKKKKHITGH